MSQHLPECGQCDAGQDCGVCLRLIDQSECRNDAGWWVLPFNCLNVSFDGLCEGSGECGTSNLADNCPAMTMNGWIGRDVYQRVRCRTLHLTQPGFTRFS